MNAAAAVTNEATERVSSRNNYDRITVNASIPVGEMAPWRREALQKIVRAALLPVNWDGYGSAAPSMAVRQTAIGFLFQIPTDELPVPHINPVPGGGFHFEWSVGPRDLEVSIEPDGRIEMLKVENDIPLEEEPLGGRVDVSGLFRWLTQL